MSSFASRQAPGSSPGQAAKTRREFGLTQAQLDCWRWLLDNGPEAVQVKVKTGGWYWLCRGETVPATPGTVNALVAAGLIEISAGPPKRLRALAALREPKKGGDA